MLMWQETEDRGEARRDQVKFALLASHQATMAQLFPEYAPDDEGPKVYESDISIDDAKRINDLINSLERSGTLSFEDLVNDEVNNGNSNRRT